MAERKTKSGMTKKSISDSCNLFRHLDKGNWTDGAMYPYLYFNPRISKSFIIFNSAYIGSANRKILRSW